MWEYATVRVTTQNLGPVAAPGFDVTCSSTAPGRKQYTRNVTKSQARELAGRRSDPDASWTNYFNSAGNHTLYVYVDSRGASDEWGAVWEYNENNNCLHHW